MTDRRARRRDLLRWGGIATAAALAGCSGSQDAGDGDDPTDTATGTPSPAASSGGPPGADVLGSEGSLQSSATVRAGVLDSDQGAGKFVFTPSVVFVEQGATVTWEIEGASHSVTAYAEGNDRPHRIPDGADAWDSGLKEGGTTWERTFETTGVHNYFCKPHEGLGMVGIVVVGEVGDGPGTTQPSELSGKAATHLSMQLENAGIGGGDGGEGGGQQYGWQQATNDSYWYSLYNMSTNIAMSGNGVRFPHNEEQREALNKRLPAILEAAGADKPPVKNPWLNMAPFTEGSPKFTGKPVLSGDDGRPDASTLRWDKAESSKTVSPSSVAWTHLKGVTWAKNFEEHQDILPGSMKPLVRAQVLTTLAQIGTNATLIAGGPEGNGALTKGDSLELISGFKPGSGEVTDDTTRIEHHTSMLWFLADLHSLAANEWFGYVNPEPLVPLQGIRKLMNGMFKTTSQAFDPETAAQAGSPRDLGLLLGGVGWFGSQAEGEMASNAATYANGIAAQLEGSIEASGQVSAEIDNQAAAQGAVGQGLAWASQLDGVDHLGTARDTLGYMRDELFDPDIGLYRAGAGSTQTYTARDVGDITGGVNAANAVLGLGSVKEQYAQFFNQCVNRGRLQRAERPPSRNQDAEHTLPLPPKAGGEFGQAAVYNGEVEYDAENDSWSVTDERFYTAEALYLANQEIWLSNWGGDFYGGSGVPGQTDEPPN
ncbi:cupredoxin domain-containing protein [Haloglomus halophilum]|uniref:cupredoxin domain-containing protein n=1 Tax=Haloglomus halophilum TaxID=2962672 RepID=UPI0020C98918|nr:plastocyanin/azurin family copper-binding protein [Haloglomus halophilum]